MIKVLNIAEFLEATTPLVDVRAPVEFLDSHISGAVNIPLLNDEHRVLVGTTYKQQGREAAIQLGYKLVNPLRQDLLKAIQSISNQKKVRLYCARGGLRSANMAQFFNEHGYEVELLKGGYKAYRKHILHVIASYKKIIILSAYTGSGKTEILKALAARKAQVLDLEDLAQHKGSAFGNLGYNGQPGSALFHNLIFDAIKGFDRNKPLWVENESVTIGKVYLPKELWENMKSAGGVEIEVPAEKRLQFTLEQYGHYEKNDLIACVVNLNKRLGDAETRRLSGLISEGQLEPVVRSLFRYYDKSYEFGRSKRNCHQYVKIHFSDLNPEEIAEFLHARQDEYLMQFS